MTDDRRGVILSLVGSRGQVAVSDVSQAIGLGPESARLALADLVGEGLLEATGENRGRRYSLAVDRHARLCALYDVLVWATSEIGVLAGEQMA